MIQFILNDKDIVTGLPGGMLLLDFIRYHRHLRGTKIGCREGDCGACTVLAGEIIDGALQYRSVTSCLMPLGNAHGKHIVTVEGVNTEGLNLVQQAFAAEGATQCGFCTPGFIVAMAGFCLNKATSVTAGIEAVSGNICRCTGYKSIERAIASISTKLMERNGRDAIGFAVENNLLPAYFRAIPERLRVTHAPTNGKPAPALTGSRYLGGGTDLYVQQHDTLPGETIEFLFDKNNLKGIAQVGNACMLGAAVTATDLLQSPTIRHYFPLMARYIKLVASAPIRNMATIAGNIVNASPIGDFTILLLALDAQLVLSGDKGRREVQLRKFFKGYKTLHKTSDEYIDKIYFQLPGVSTRLNFEKVCKRTHLDIASVNSAIQIEMDEDTIVGGGISAGGVAPVPMFLANTSAFMQGKKISAALIRGLIETAQEEISPISDTRGSDTYKRLLLGQLIKAHFITLFPAEQFNIMDA